jgi:hypothetical protein
MHVFHEINFGAIRNFIYLWESALPMLLMSLIKF